MRRRKSRTQQIFDQVCIHLIFLLAAFLVLLLGIRAAGRTIEFAQSEKIEIINNLVDGLSQSSKLKVQGKRLQTVVYKYLEALVEAPGLAEEWKVRPRYQLEMARKNRPGMVANDFAYRTADGRTRRLHETGGELTLLFFYNPDCRDCARVEGVIGRSAVLGPLVKEGRLTVLAMYPDADLAAWREHLPRMPRGWTVGYDEGRRITRERLYALPAMPTLYLLDVVKRVVLKDAPVERFVLWLHENMEKS